MPTLTRRRYPKRHECWHVYYGDVHVGTIALRTGNPHDTDPWEWCCGFYPGSRPGECRSGTAATFDDARADFESAWRVFLSKRTEADFQAWRDQEAWTAEKYRRFDRGRAHAVGLATTTTGHRWLSAAGNGLSMIRSRFPAAASSSPWRTPATTSPHCRRPSTKHPNGKPRWRR
jgi:hypothetical protein